MGSKIITVRLLDRLYERLQSYTLESDSSETDMIVAAMASYFGTGDQMPLIEELFS